MWAVSSWGWANSSNLLPMKTHKRHAIRSSYKPGFNCKKINKTHSVALLLKMGLKSLVDH